MSYPKIKFQKNAEKDWKTICIFTKEAVYDNGRNLDWAIFNKYHKLKKFFSLTKKHTISDEKNLRKFIKQTYKNKTALMTASMNQYKNNWEKVAPFFFKLIDNLFKTTNWPKGKYIAYGTIWGLFPRFLDDKTFQIPYWHKRPQYISVIIAHELLHFKFYDYFYKKYPQYNYQKYNYFVWNISEIFNSIIQNSPEWLKYFKLKSLNYPEHEKIISKIARSEYKLASIDIDVLVQKIIIELNKKN